VITTVDVLRQLDECAEGFDWPDPGHPNAVAIDARLHVFRDQHRWALVIELVGYNLRNRDIVDVVHRYGNCLTHGEPGYDELDFLGRIDNMNEVEGDFEQLAAGRPSLEIRGRRVAVPGTEGEPLADVFRRLVPEHRDLLLADDGELRRRLPADLPRILVLDEWWHRDPDDWEVVPSACETFQQLADVLTTGDVSAYRPTRKPNTHWSFWPRSGSH
jgi:hypothetical protein